MESFKTTNNPLFRSYYKQYYCEALDKLKVCFVPEDWFHIDAFSINGNCIFCDFSLIEKFNLSEKECFSCIAHEVGHFISPSKDVLSDQAQRELHADRYAVKLNLADSLISALNKMCPNEELTKLRIEKMSSATS